MRLSMAVRRLAVVVTRKARITKLCGRAAAKATNRLTWKRSGSERVVLAVRWDIIPHMKRSGVADLPLHGGRVPDWLAQRMTRLGAAISEAIIYDYGTSAFLSRISDPFWFQALGAVMGMDWPSSGITTSVLGALKRGLTPKADELGLYICGGRAR